MSELSQKLGEVAKKHGKAAAKELVIEALYPALQALVAKSETKIDDAVLLALGEPLKAELIKIIDAA